MTTPQTFAIRRALPSDVGALQFDIADGRPVATHSLTEWFNRADVTTFVATDTDGRVIAQIMTRVHQDEGDERRFRYFFFLFVSQSHRRRGIATALIETVEALARDESCAGVCLSVEDENESARVLYERRGYVEYGVAPGECETSDGAKVTTSNRYMWLALPGNEAVA